MGAREAAAKTRRLTAATPEHYGACTTRGGSLWAMLSPEWGYHPIACDVHVLIEIQQGLQQPSGRGRSWCDGQIAGEGVFWRALVI